MDRSIPNMSSNTGNLITSYFNKLIDVEEQKFSEKAQISLILIDFLHVTGQCTDDEYTEVKYLIQYTDDRIDRSICELDMMIDPNDRLPYDKAKKYERVFFAVEIDKFGPKVTTTSCKYRVDKIQGLLFRTTFKVVRILHKILLERKLIDETGRLL